MRDFRTRTIGFGVSCALLAIQVVDGGSSEVVAGDNQRSGSDYYAGLNCGQLWYERNAIFAAHGFCFKTPRAVSTFGKRCHPPYGKLPSNLKSVVDHIKSLERRRGC